MKNNCLFLFLFSSLAANAQISLNSSNIPPIGAKFTDVSHNNTVVPGLTISAPGPNQSWNYSTGWILSDTTFTEVKSPAGLPQNNLFPNSTMVITNITNPSYPLYGYAGITSTGLRIDGFFAVNTQSTYTVKYEGINFLDLPLAYGNVINYTSKYTAVIVAGTFAQKSISRKTGTKTVDAWGSLTTPKTTYPSVLRVKNETLTTLDSTFVDATGSGNFVFSSVNSSLNANNDYAFYANLPYPVVMSLRANKNTGLIIFDKYNDNSIVAAVNEREISEKSAGSFYPNPASGMLHFAKNSPLVSKMELVNLSGQVVFSYSMNDLDQLSIATERFANGFYSWRLLNTEGAVLQAGKVLVKN